MRIALVVNPREGEVTDRVTPIHYKPKAVKYMPLGLLSLAATLVDDHDVKVIDAQSRGLDIHATLAEIDAFRPDVLGLSVMTYTAWPMTQILNKSDVPIKVVGGPRATYNARSIFDQGAHAVFVGDAEESFPNWLRSGCPKGIFSSDPVPLDSTPLPARNLIDLDDYRIDNTDELLFDAGALRIPMYSSKGCPLKCTYCDVQQKTYNFKSPQMCAHEFQVLADMGATSIHILDDAFNIRKDRCIGIAEAVFESDVNIEWSARGTVEIRENVIASLKKAGLKRYHVGIEHLDDRVLEYFKKSSRFKHIKKFADLCNKYEIDILAYFIIGAPVETTEYRANLPSMIEDLGVRYPYFNILTPLAETPFYRDLLGKGVWARDVWKDFCEKPVPNFVIPQFRTESEEEEIRTLVAGYIEHFDRRGNSATA